MEAARHALCRLCLHHHPVLVTPLQSHAGQIVNENNYLVEK